MLNATSKLLLSLSLALTACDYDPPPEVTLEIPAEGAFLSGDPTIVPVTIACLTLAAFLGLGNGAVFKAVPQDFPTATGAATGIVGAAGGLGGFFPPIVMGIVKDHFDTYALGFIGLVAFAAVCLVVSLTMRTAGRTSAEVVA